MTNEQIDELLAEIGRAPFLTRDEELALLKAVKEKGADCDEMKQLEKARMRLVVSLISQYQHRGLTLEKLIEAGKASLRNAAENYDLNSDSNFITYALPHMRQCLEVVTAQNCAKDERSRNTRRE